MLSAALVAASAASKQRSATVAGLLQRFGEAPPWERMTMAAPIMGAVLDAFAARDAHSDALEREISALADQVQRLHARLYPTPQAPHGG